MNLIRTQNVNLQRFAMVAAISTGVLAFQAAAQESEPESSLEGEWLRWGPVNLRPRASTGLTYDDNITLSPTNELSDVFWSFTPGLSLVAGDVPTRETPSFSLDYDANLMVFNDHSEFNDVNHSLGLDARWPMAKLTLGATAGYDMVSTALYYVAERVDQDLYRLGLTSRYQFSEKTSFEVNGSYRESKYSSGLIGSKEWSNDNWVDHQTTGKLSVGVGATFGYLEPDVGPAQKYQRVMLRSNYKLTYKLNVDASVGGEFRQYDGYPMSSTPVFNLGVNYRPVERTTIRLNGYRREQNSLTQVEVNQITTGVSLNVRQQVWDRIGVSAGGSYENSEYRAVSGAATSERLDDYFAVNVGLDVTFSARWKAALTAQHRESTSDSPNGIIFDNNIVSLHTSYSF